MVWVSIPPYSHSGFFGSLIAQRTQYPLLEEDTVNSDLRYIPKP